jgi:hypothetical protein
VCESRIDLRPSRRFPLDFFLFFYEFDVHERPGWTWMWRCLLVCFVFSFLLLRQDNNSHFWFISFVASLPHTNFCVVQLR